MKTRSLSQEFLVNLQSEHIMSEEFSREINKIISYGEIRTVLYKIQARRWLL